MKWVEPHNLHLTLKFLGDVHQREIAEVCQAVARGAAEVAPFELEVRGAGAFPPPPGRAPSGSAPATARSRWSSLHDRVEDALAELGYRKEHRRFQVHLTIGRVRGGGPEKGTVQFAGTARRVLRQMDLSPFLLQQHADFAAGRMSVEKLTVFASTLTPAGPIYEVLGTARLGG